MEPGKLDASVRHPKENMCAFPALLERIAAIEGIPNEAVRPLGALIRSSGVETGSRRAEAWRKVRHALTELVEVLEETGESRSESIMHARALLRIAQAGSTAPAPRIDVVARAIVILKACGCQMKEAARYTADLYPIIGWGRVYAESIKTQFYNEAPEELRALDDEGRQRIREEFERLADQIELDDPPQ